MGKKARVLKRKQMVRWTPRRLSELVAEQDRLKRQVRVAEAAIPTTTPPRLAR